MKYILIPIIASLFFALPVSAQEIFYANIGDIHETSVALRYGSPTGDQLYICNTETSECEETSDTLLPQEAKAANITLSPHGERAISLAANNLLVTVYDVERDGIEKNVSISFDIPVLFARFTRDGSKVIIVHDTHFGVYNLETLNSNTTPYSATNFRNFLVSPSGHYTSYVTGGSIHITNLENGLTAQLPSTDLVYFEISENGQWGAYKERNASGTTLWRVDLSSFPQINRTAAFTTDREVDDYIFFDNDLYFTTNGSEDSPYAWTLIKHDPATETETTIDSPISYLDFMKTTEDALLYHKVDESISSIYALHANDISGTRLMGIEPEPLEVEIERQAVNIAGMHGVLLQPEDTAVSENLPLIVWLHGGPMRQTSLEYHPYLSYAVYDELLEKIAENTRVLKLDYPGSWGYGQEYMEVLQGGIGVADRIGVENAVQEFRDIYSTDELHLVGNSYGAYLALRYAVEHPNDVESVTSIAGVSDWRSLISQIPSSVFTPRFNGTPNYTNEHLYAQADILHQLPGLNNTRLLVVYGTQDTTVPVWQSKYLVPTTRAYDIPTETLVFEDEGHIITKRENLERLCEETEGVLQIEIDC